MTQGSPDYPQTLYREDFLQSSEGSSGNLPIEANNQAYVVNIGAALNNVSGSTITLTLKLRWTENGVLTNMTIAAATSSAVGAIGLGGSMVVYPDQGTAVQFTNDVTGFGAGDEYNYHIAVQGMPTGSQFA